MTDPQSRTYRRKGTVTATQLTQVKRWKTSAGDELSGEPGDWLVIDGSGGERTVKEALFPEGYVRVSGDTYRRVGTVEAYRVAKTETIRTLEGDATARAGDWIVAIGPGNRWPVPNDHFQASYELDPEAPSG